MKTEMSWGEAQGVTIFIPSTLPLVCRFSSQNRCGRSDVGRTGVCCASWMWVRPVCAVRACSLYCILYILGSRICKVFALSVFLLLVLCGCLPRKKNTVNMIPAKEGSTNQVCPASRGTRTRFAKNPRTQCWSVSARECACSCVCVSASSN